jgi:hypothetical protein
MINRQGATMPVRTEISPDLVCQSLPNLSEQLRMFRLNYLATGAKQ